ncbi:MAG: bifunctional 5,10-methylenetetrahydrofolate dehydrogenase/5,10-methenyltetrahydrofolate cyclohydrolase [Candidatus Magasanikbacteria bacterium]
MSAEIIKGEKIAKEIEDKTKKKVEALAEKEVVPKLGVVYIGDNQSSQTYINKKRDKANELGIEFEVFSFPSEVTKKEIKQELKEIQNGDLDGLIVQLPVPNRLYPDILDLVKPDLDVDCLTSENLGKLVKHNSNFVPPTAGAIMEVLKQTGTELKGKNITVVGTGILVGKPTAIILMNKEATVTTCNEFTKNLKQKCLQADIIISGVGKKHLINEEMISEGTTIVDAGIDYDQGKAYGDVKKDEIKQKADFITPTPGGIGPITVSKLLENVALAAEYSLASN